MKKNLTLYMILFLLTSTLFPSAVFASTSNSVIPVSSTENTIQPNADVIDYQYRLIDGILYKRLYNYTTKKPLSDWDIAK